MTTPPTHTTNDAAPPLAVLMGFGGLVPFFICAGAAHSGVAPWAGLALIINGVYGAVILSFIGAVHWGLAIQGDRSQRWFVWSVVPALYAWPPVVFLDARTALLALVPGFLLSWSVDRRAALVYAASSYADPWCLDGACRRLTGTAALPAWIADRHGWHAVQSRALIIIRLPIATSPIPASDGSVHS